jgi:hypothetical protein
MLWGEKSNRVGRRHEKIEQAERGKTIKKKEEKKKKKGKKTIPSKI